MSDAGPLSLVIRVATMLDKIIERAAPSVVGSPTPPSVAPAAPAPDPQHGRWGEPRRHDPRDERRRRRRRRRRSFLEEIFDFD